MKSLSDFLFFALTVSAPHDSDIGLIGLKVNVAQKSMGKAPRVEPSVPFSYAFARESDIIIINCPSTTHTRSVL